MFFRENSARLICFIFLILMVSSCKSDVPSVGLKPTPSPHIIYLHGRIIEDQGLNAYSPVHGAYEFVEIVDRFRAEGFAVYAEQRPQDADANVYALKTHDYIKGLIKEGVKPHDITVIGASKGAYIATLVSHMSEYTDMKFVLLAGCSSGVIDYMRDEGITFSGHVMAIRDVADTEYAGSCQPIFDVSSKLQSSQQLIVQDGTGHGLIFRAFDSWVLPAISWARQ